MTAIDLIFPYSATSHGVTVRVAPRFLPDQSDESEPRFVWSYHVRVENHGGETVQLHDRFWRITDADGHVEIAEGPGVIGQTPVIEPGGAFDYVSGCPLATPSGTMEGHYGMSSDSGRFDAAIPAFALVHPTLKPSIN
ncbi:protein ApaG [Polymorphobacter glacialis]|uniref:Protein ApaG n=1 Tax=Sandarakinorhabdus glacialis TaxID=1614636 RepID=A0A916ZHQ0_9SPHN|nr:Co2+/Mg2+ efflux protein ApaG [Polymorphobacter glacialis]GGD98655.1 protein ApaG [Polymorphobacter glacialis]